MSPTTSPAAVVAPAPAKLYGVWPASPAAAGSSFRDSGLNYAFSRVLLVLGGLGEMLIIGFAFPLAVLAVGIPIALLVRLVVEIGQSLWRL